MKKISTDIQQLFIVHTLVFCFLAAGFTQLYGYVIEDNVLNNQLRQEAQFLEDEFIRTGVMPAPRYPFMKREQNWKFLPDSIQKQREESSDRVEFTGPEGENIHIISLSPCTESCLLVAYVDDYIIADKAWLFSAGGMLAITIILMLVSTFGILGLLNRITSPIRELQKQVEKGAPELKFAERFTENMPNNEVGFLAQTIASQWRKMTELLDREKHFTRDISHEIRTPLSVIQNQIAQLQSLKKIDTQLTKLQLNKITQILDVLTALARSETQDMSCVQVLKTIEEVTLALSIQGLPEDFEIELNIPVDYMITCNQHLFELLLKNLIENAYTHSIGNKLHISVNEHSLIFANSLSGELPANITEKGVKGNQSRGLGQGLSLVQRIMEFHQGELTINTSIHNHQSQFEVRVSFP